MSKKQFSSVKLPAWRNSSVALALSDAARDAEAKEHYATATEYYGLAALYWRDAGEAWVADACEANSETCQRKLVENTRVY